MPKFSERSTRVLDECHVDLRILFERVVRKFDCTILVGHRTMVEQNEAFDKGLSKLQYPKSKHNKQPALAVDVAPYPIDWKDTERFYYFAGYVMGVASELGLEVRWGGDWDGDTEVNDQTFMDLVHFELPNPT